MVITEGSCDGQMMPGCRQMKKERMRRDPTAAKA